MAWLPLAYPHLNWDWLTANAKLRDRQNRLGFVVVLARQAPREMEAPSWNKNWPLASPSWSLPAWRRKILYAENQ
jgi:hypothetical protein